MTQTPANPFTLVYDALWALVEAHPSFTEMVKAGNRIKYNIPDDRDPLKASILTGDLPEVVLVGRTTSGNVMNTSNTSMVTRSYEFLVSTGDFRYTELLAQIEWQLFTATTGWREKLAALEWKNKRFVKRVNMTGSTMGASDPERNRKIRGWSCAWGVEVEMHFQTTDLSGELG